MSLYCGPSSHFPDVESVNLTVWTVEVIHIMFRLEFAMKPKAVVNKDKTGLTHIIKKKNGGDGG